MKNGCSMKIKGMHTQPFPIIMTLRLYSYQCQYIFIIALLHFIAKLVSTIPNKINTKSIRFNWYVANCGLYSMVFMKMNEMKIGSKSNFPNAPYTMTNTAYRYRCRCWCQYSLLCLCFEAFAIFRIFAEFSYLNKILWFFSIRFSNTDVNCLYIFFLLLPGLERIAEELMGRRKWKLYQEVLVRSHSNSNTTVATANNQITNITETGN